MGGVCFTTIFRLTKLILIFTYSITTHLSYTICAIWITIHSFINTPSSCCHTSRKERIAIFVSSISKWCFCAILISTNCSSPYTFFWSSWTNHCLTQFFILVQNTCPWFYTLNPICCALICNTLTLCMCSKYIACTSTKLYAFRLQISTTIGNWTRWFWSEKTTTQLTVWFCRHNCDILFLLTTFRPFTIRVQKTVTLWSKLSTYTYICCCYNSSLISWY